MAHETFLSLSGNGYQAFTNAGQTFGFIAGLTDVGRSELLDGASNGRRSHIGWVAPVEDYSGGGPDGTLPAGLYRRNPIWIPFDFFTFIRENRFPFEVTGLDGFVYFFGPDVVADMIWLY